MTNDQHQLVIHLVEEIDGAMKENDYQRMFFESLRDEYEKRHHLSPKQIVALNNIYERVTR